MTISQDDINTSLYMTSVCTCCCQAVGFDGLCFLAFLIYSSVIDAVERLGMAEYRNFELSTLPVPLNFNNTNKQKQVQGGCCYFNHC